MTALGNGGMLAGGQLRTEIPFLRRFGRALTGDQVVADLSVVQLMDDLLSLPRLTGTMQSSRVDMYRLYLSILETAAVEISEDSMFGLATPRSRQGYFLKHVEGFADDEAADILCVTLPDFRALLKSAHDEVAQQSGSNVLIIEDEFFIALELENIVTDLGHQVSGCARTHSEGISEIRRMLPDIILSDVQLADGSSGIEAIEEIQTIANIPAIFITAYPERFLTGNRREPAFLIAKPFNTSAVRATISQALYLSRHRDCLKKLLERTAN